MILFHILKLPPVFRRVMIFQNFQTQQLDNLLIWLDCFFFTVTVIALST